MKKNHIKLVLLLMLFLATLTACEKSKDDVSPQPIDPPKEESVPQEVIPEKIDEDILLLESMTLEEKIGQLLIVGYKEDNPNAVVQELIINNHIGGFILFKRNYKDMESMVQITNQLQAWNKTNKIPLFLALDEEGGTVSRLPKEGTKLPDARLLGKIDDTKLTYEAGAVIGEELKALGINMNYAPVIDIVTTSENKLLYKRSFGNDPELVARHGVEFIKGLQDKGVLATPKHFPGHGSTTVDSHGKLPKIMVDKETLLSRELVPFKAVIDSGVDGIMIGHLAFPLIDNSELPATKSKILLEEILRKELNFQGLIITDEIEMLGYMTNKDQLRSGIIQSLQAGVDIFVIGHTHQIQLEVINIIEEALKNNIISESRINESVLRIIKLKRKYLNDNVSVDVESAKNVVGSEEHRAIVTEIKKAAELLR